MANPVKTLLCAFFTTNAKSAVCLSCFAYKMGSSICKLGTLVRRKQVLFFYPFSLPRHTIIHNNSVLSVLKENSGAK